MHCYCVNIHNILFYPVFSLRAFLESKLLYILNDALRELLCVYNVYVFEEGVVQLGTCGSGST